MQEGFLHYIWQFQYFNKGNLITSDGEKINVQFPGFLNQDAGPDFRESKILIESIEWRGSIEIHIKSSDWNLHKHTANKAYDNVVLHVVWQDDKKVFRSDGSVIPVLELKDRVDLDLLKRFQALVEEPDENIPCSKSIAEVPDILKIEMLDRVAMERLELKSGGVIKRLEALNGNWEETAYQFLARSFGLKINAEPFEKLSSFLPFKLVKKHIQSSFELESLIFGVAGFLEDNIADEYYLELRKQYIYLKHKYELHLQLNKEEWKFLRLRPANFPTLRLAQFASMLKGNSNLFDAFLNISTSKDLNDWLIKSPSDYWKNHLNFGKTTPQSSNTLGKSTRDVIVINTVVPIVAAYGKYVNDQKYVDQAVTLLENIKAETNKIINGYISIGFNPSSALDSQALLHLSANYCSKKRCFKCSIGNHIIRPR